jgi:hypothetical protein
VGSVFQQSGMPFREIYWLSEEGFTSATPRVTCRILYVIGRLMAQVWRTGLSHPAPCEADYLQRGRPELRCGSKQVHIPPQGDGPWVMNPDPYAADGEMHLVARQELMAPQYLKLRILSLVRGVPRVRGTSWWWGKPPIMALVLRFTRVTLREVPQRPRTVARVCVARYGNPAVEPNSEPGRPRAMQPHESREGVAPRIDDPWQLPAYHSGRMHSVPSEVGITPPAVPIVTKWVTPLGPSKQWLLLRQP